MACCAKERLGDNARKALLPWIAFRSGSESHGTWTNLQVSVLSIASMSTEVEATSLLLPSHYQMAEVPILVLRGAMLTAQGLSNCLQTLV